MNEQKLYKFKGVATRCTYNSPDYKIYACDVDKQKFPEVKQNKYNNVSILGRRAN